METHTLICHPETPSGAIKFVTSQIELRYNDIQLIFVVEGKTDALSLLRPAKPCRTDGLWKTTCFEAFVKDSDGSYCEFNFSPSLEWAAYSFSEYRSEHHDLALDWPPKIVTSDEGYFYYVSVLLPRMAWDGNQIALSAVIEELDGTKSYWALAHPTGQPDFHHPSCFTATLPAPEHP